MITKTRKEATCIFRDQKKGWRTIKHTYGEITGKIEVITLETITGKYYHFYFSEVDESTDDIDFTEMHEVKITKYEWEPV